MNMNTHDMVHENENKRNELNFSVQKNYYYLFLLVLFFFCFRQRIIRNI